MSEEEKKAIEELKEEINKPIEVPEDKFNTFILYNIKNAKIILSIVENQQKEIEELKESKKELIEAIEEWVNGERINDIKHIRKDKIREKIKEIENVETDKISREEYNRIEFAIETLLELLEEK